MKKSLIILLIITSASLAFAKFDFGAKFGMHHSYLRSNEFADQTYWENDSEFKGVSAETMGAFASFSFESYTFYIEAYYSAEGFSIYSPYNQYNPQPDIEVYNTCINNFALLRYNWPFAFASPFISVGLSASLPINISVIGSPNFDQENFLFTKIGVCTGIGAKFLDVADIEFRYILGLNDIYSGVNGKTTTSNLLSLSIGVYFIEIFNRPGEHPRF